MKFKLNAKTFKYQICFQGLSRAFKTGKNFSPGLSTHSGHNGDNNFHVKSFY